MTKKIYLETLKSVLDRSVFYYFRMGPYGQQQEKEHAETAYGRFIH